MKKKFIIFLAALIAGCSLKPKDNVKEFHGYWVSGQAYSYFTLQDRTKSYWLLDTAIPSNVVKFLGEQPMYEDPFTKTGECHAVQLHILGRIENCNLYSLGTTQCIRLVKVLSMESTPREFFEQGAHPLPPVK
jgi:hypothetical protein